ncbi:MAG: 16S rRNA (guanine(527)-N(7))-methyltransferase RsmG [Dokdonella sp.]|uniref:16S rRNA (guanine(527)-N(7))-methyltransferase RsmG n=1 Tax=Dokdonella sp. TaxID=2291710 RepID=UPI002CCFC900|nr:16S rRNA (guanine(527)-N(7))-methyltransferase RsmG [Dokdonella sp.]HOX71493.1 16S rRNA (guanine(527)-N(7))-methyltransferase RsmG [Dokdonella sp.]HPG93384.1 16S rRNA (guanine(527)-N(7))-methyltransferase RsmG [Dokdonella sp.]HPN78676.1 16S rRNA (guanine(527)-N(7))-methyltransferase RsmG [Dokdonella sp.]
MSDREPLRQRLLAGLKTLKLELDASTIEQLLDYVDLLVRWNAAYNLTAVRDAGEMVTRHLLDSLAVLPFVAGRSLVDLGTGAGLPGIPLALARPDLEVCLVDSNGKKTRFLREAVRQLRLKRTRVEESRVEAVRGEFDCVSARAFATLDDMLTLGGHLLAADGRWLALKGRFPQDELDKLPAGFSIDAVHRLDVPGLDAERHLVIIKRKLDGPAARNHP